MGMCRPDDFVAEIEKHIAVKTALADELLARIERLQDPS